MRHGAARPRSQLRLPAVEPVVLGENEVRAGEPQSNVAGDGLEVAVMESGAGLAVDVTFSIKNNASSSLSS